MTMGGAPGGVPTSGGAATSDPPHGAGGAEEQSSIGIAAGEFERARRAILARTIPASGGRRFVNGPPKERLIALLEQHGTDAVLVAAERVPAETYLVPHFVEQLADVLDGAGDELPAEVADERRQRLEQRITSLRNQRDVYLRSGVDADDDIIAVIVGEITECENDLQQLDAEGAA